VSLSQPSLGGSYTGANPMGLLTGAQAAPAKLLVLLASQ
jgi:hypothetical protein